MTATMQPPLCSPPILSFPPRRGKGHNMGTGEKTGQAGRASSAFAIFARTYAPAASAFHGAALAGASATAFAFSFFGHFTPPFMFSIHIDGRMPKKTQTETSIL